MMTPVGRLVLLRSIDKSALVNAMAWVTVPALIGPVIGPPLGGFITTYFSWHWIFLINIPIGLLGIFMALRYIDPIRSEDPERFDLYGLILAGIGLGGIAFGLSVAGLNLLPWTVVVALIAVGSISMTLYVIHAKRTASPVLDFTLMRLPTLRASIIGGFLFRLGIGALPFLLPLLMQVGFGLSPFKSGLVTFASAVGAMGMKTLAARIIRTFGFRNIMTINAVVSSIFLAACALFTVIDAAAADHDHPGGRRLLPLAAIHRHQHGRLCRGRAGADEPRHHAGQRQPATGDFSRRCRRRVLGGNDHAAASCQRTQRRRFRARPSSWSRSSRRCRPVSSSKCRSMPAIRSPAAAWSYPILPESDAEDEAAARRTAQDQRRAKRRAAVRPASGISGILRHDRETPSPARSAPTNPSGLRPASHA